VSEDIGEFVRNPPLQNGAKSSSASGVPKLSKIKPPLPRLISLEDEDADAENDDDEDERGRSEKLFEANLGGGVTLQRIPAKTSKSEGGKVG